VQSPSLVSDFGFDTVNSVMEVDDAVGILAMVDLGDGVAVEAMLEDVGGFEAVAAGFFLQAPRHWCSTRTPWGWMCRCLRRRHWTARGWWSHWQRRRRRSWLPGGRPSIGSPTSLFFTMCRMT